MRSANDIRNANGIRNAKDIRNANDIRSANAETSKVNVNEVTQTKRVQQVVLDINIFSAFLCNNKGSKTKILDSLIVAMFVVLF